MKCPWCGLKLDAELTAFIVHAAALHTSEIKDIATKLMTSDVVWVVPTPEPGSEPKEEV